MKRTIATLAAAILLAGCAAMGANTPPPAGPVFTLWSPGHPDGSALQQRHAGNLSSNPNCVGQNISPPLAWTNVPAGTRSFAMIMYDQEGRSGLGVAHWVAYNIPANVTAFAENEVSRPSPKFTGGKSTQNQAIYMGPCPPVNTGQHHYVYTVIATDLEPGALPAGLAMNELLERLNGRAKGGSSIVLRYGR